MRQSKVEETEGAKGYVSIVADDYVVEHLDLEQLPGPNQVPGHLDVRLRGTRVARGVIVLCDAPSYVQRPIGGAGHTPAFREEGVPWIRVSYRTRVIPSSPSAG